MRNKETMRRPTCGPRREVQDLYGPVQRILFRPYPEHSIYFLCIGEHANTFCPLLSNKCPKNVRKLALTTWHVQMIFAQCRPLPDVPKSWVFSCRETLRVGVLSVAIAAGVTIHPQSCTLMDMPIVGRSSLLRLSKQTWRLRTVPTSAQLTCLSH